MQTTLKKCKLNKTRIEPDKKNPKLKWDIGYYSFKLQKFSFLFSYSQILITPTNKNWSYHFWKCNSQESEKGYKPQKWNSYLPLYTRSCISARFKTPQNQPTKNSNFFTNPPKKLGNWFENWSGIEERERRARRVLCHACVSRCCFGVNIAAIVEATNWVIHLPPLESFLAICLFLAVKVAILEIVTLRVLALFLSFLLLFSFMVMVLE